MTAGNNWAGNYSYRAPRLRRPQSIDQLRDLVAGSTRVKALGSRHCFNDIADTSGDLIDLTALPEDLEIADDARSVTVSAAVRYGRLAPLLQARSLALHNLASLPHISVAGAIATGTHGSGAGNRGLGGAVSGIELVCADGELVRLNRGDDDFPGAVVSLGALGVLTRVTLDVEPAFEVRQDVFEDLPWAELDANFDEITGSAYSVSLFTDYQGPTVAQVWCKSKTSAAADSAVFDTTGAVQTSFFGAKPATVARHPLPGLPGDVCTGQLGAPGPWHDRLPHFQLAFTPSNGNEVQTEYLVPRVQAGAVIDVLRGLATRLAPLLQVAEIRRVKADDLWLSPSYQQDSVAFHFTWINDEPAVMKLLAVIEAEIAPCAPRPHWGKLFAADYSTLETVYERIPDFRALAERMDPQGAFRNDYLDRYIYADR